MPMLVKAELNPHKPMAMSDEGAPQASPVKAPTVLPRA